MSFSPSHVFFGKMPIQFLCMFFELDHVGLFFFFAIVLYGMTFNGLIGGKLWLGLDPLVLSAPRPCRHSPLQV